MITYKIKVEKYKDGFWGSVENHDGVVSQGDTLEELKENMTEALNLYFEDDNIIVEESQLELIEL